MARYAWNVTKGHYIELPGEAEEGDIIQMSKEDNTPVHWVKKSIDGKRAHWATNPSIAQILNGSGKGGIMTEIHRQGELEIYCKFYDEPIELVPPREISCPAAQFCDKNCKIKTTGAINLRCYYPDTPLYDPPQNISNEYSCDIVFPNYQENEEFGIEVRNTHKVSHDKWLSGMPMIEFHCSHENELMQIKEMKCINLLDADTLQICKTYNLGFLPPFRDLYPCNCLKIREVLWSQKEKQPKTKRTSTTQKATLVDAPFTGYEPWDKWGNWYPYVYEGKLVEWVIRHDPGVVNWCRHEARTWPPIILLSRRTRALHNLAPSTYETQMDQIYVNYLKSTQAK